MWVVIYMAKSLIRAQSACDLLVKEGFLVRKRPVYRTLSDDENYFELKVPELEAEEARQVLSDHGF